MNTSPNNLENLKIGESHLTQVSHGLETIFIRETTDNFVLRIVTHDTKKEITQQRITITNRRL